MVIMITRSDGGVSVMQVVEGADPDECLNKWKASHAGEYVSHRVGSLDELPKERTFRNAWTGGAKINVDMPKARNIWRDRMREARSTKLAALDIEYQRADEVSDAVRKQEIALKKQALRDVPALPEIEAANTPEELKAVWPDILADQDAE
jgi:uncharacterized pyridoxamine 5'-phosphate oxidase family protein